MARKAKRVDRSASGLRDVLFDEIEELRSGAGDPSKSLAVANLAKQIINVAKVEIDFQRQVIEQNEKGQDFGIGHMKLGNAASAATRATGR